MSPLLGSSGGSSEYAFRGTLDDWPVDFSAALTLQNLTGIDPTSVGIATLNITGLNYKVRVTSESDVSSVRAVHEVNTNVGFGTTAVTDGRQIFSRRKESDPALLVRDQSKIELLLTPIVGFKTSFSKTYDIPLNVGKRSGNWRVTTRDIDESPTPFGFTPRINVELGITTISTAATISGLENNFDFNISVIANPSLDPGIPAANVKLFKNGIEIVGGIGTVSNGDQIYLSTISPNRYATPRTFAIQVGTYSTDWSILTRDAVTTVRPFGFTGISSANQLGFGYTSTYMDVLDADPGIGISVSMTGGFFQIFKSDGTLRYPGANPLLPSWQNTPTFAFNTDRINVKVDSSGSYNTTTSGTLSVSDQSGTFNVTTRPTPVDTIPNSITNLFTDVGSQPRSAQITSNSITIGGMTTGASDFASASISASPTTVIPQFEVQRPGSGIVKPFDNATTFNVRNNDSIRLRLTTPNDAINNGDSTSLFTLNINGTSNVTDTITPLNNPEGYIVSNGTVFDTWSVRTIARQCEVSPFVLTAASGVIRGTDVSRSFQVQGFDGDCQMFVRVNSSSTSPSYRFTSLILPGGTVETLPANTTSIPNVSVGSTVNLTARASSSILPASVNVIIDVSNADPGNLVTPKTNGGLGFSTSWTISSVGDTSPSSITLTGPTGAVTTGQSFTLSWTSDNCLSIRSITGPSGPITPVPTTSVPTGSITLTAPVVGAGLLSQVFTYTIVSDMNTAASNYTTAGAVSTVSVTVDQDFVPDEPGNFTNLDPVTPGTPLTSRFFRSNVLTITGISTQLTAVVRTPTSNGSDGILNLNPLPIPPLTGEQPAASVVSSKTIKPNDSIQLQLAAAPADGPTGYLTTTTVTVDFKDPLNVVRLTKSFSVKTSACQRQTKQVTFGDAANSVTLEYDVSAIYTQGNRGTQQGTQASDDLLKGSVLGNGFVSGIGSATGYYAVAPFTGLFINGTSLSWQTLVTQTFAGFTTTAQRPPSDTEIVSIFNSINPNTLVSISGLILPTLRSSIVNFALGVVNRDTTTAILDTPCGANIIAPGGVYT
jgi:hypothetical protein